MRGYSERDPERQRKFLEGLLQSDARLVILRAMCGLSKAGV
jgi:hypothetical protein